MPIVIYPIDKILTMEAEDLCYTYVHLFTSILKYMLLDYYIERITLLVDLNHRNFFNMKLGFFKKVFND